MNFSNGLTTMNIGCERLFINVDDECLAWMRANSFQQSIYLLDKGSYILSHILMNKFFVLICCGIKCFVKKMMKKNQKLRSDLKDLWKI